MAAVRIILSLLIFPTITSAGGSCRNAYSQSGYALVDHAYKSFFTGRLALRYMSCNMQPTCQSLNYNPIDKTCELNNDTKYFWPTHFVKKPEFVYTENLDSETPWRKLNLAPVCFGAKDNRFGRFQVDVRGSIQAVKLVHLSEQVCCTHYQISWSNWGCDRPQQVQYISVFLTDASNTILLPVNQTAPYIIPGYNAKSSELVFRGFPTPLHLFPGQELRLWYWEDLRDLSEYDNNGTSCTDVFAKYL